jgi:hypothetical protein
MNLFKRFRRNRRPERIPVTPPRRRHRPEADAPYGGYAGFGGASDLNADGVPDAYQGGPLGAMLGDGDRSGQATDSGSHHGHDHGGSQHAHDLGPQQDTGSPGSSDSGSSGSSYDSGYSGGGSYDSGYSGGGSSYDSGGSSYDSGSSGSYDSGSSGW